MTDKYLNKYRIKSHRRPNWDYSNNGAYFITICTQHNICNLGKIENNKMNLSDYGKIIETEWHKSFEIRKELFLDEFIIMPNHMHAIIILENNEMKMNDDMDGDMPVQTHGRASLSSQMPSQSPSQMPIRLPKSISSFIAGFKSAINSKIDDYIDENNLDIPKYNRKNHFFQPNYNDHIIRNDKAYHNIKNYIINHPTKWEKDKFNSTDNE